MNGMQRKKSVVATAVILAGFLVGHASANDKIDPKAKKVWDRSIEVTYGKVAKTRSVKSMQITAEMAVPMAGMTSTFKMLQQGGKFKVDVDIKNMGTMTECYDGKHAWSFSELQGPAVKSEKETLQSRQQGDLYATIDWEKYYDSIEYVDDETIDDGTGKKVKTHVLALKSKATGQEDKAYFDAETGLEVRMDAQILIPGGTMVPSTTLFWDYRDAAGMQLPFRTKQTVGPMTQEITVKEVKANVDVPADAFKAPDEVQKLIDKK